MALGHLYCTATSQIFKEPDMSTASYAPSNDALRHYFADVSKAARAFASALFAAQERQYITQEVVVKPAVSERVRAKNRAGLFSLANQYDAELRNLASRD
jgi:hypothetical protein